MPRAFACLMVLMLAAASTIAAPPDDAYQLGPDSEPHEGVPQGKVIGPTALPSKVYPNTTRDYWVYVPAQYDPSKPACLMIFFDGHAYVGLKGNYRIPYVFDNLIYRREMPVTIGVFINPGHTARPEGGLRRRLGRPHHQPPRRIQRAGRQILQAHRRRAAAGLEQAVQHLRRTRRPRDLRGQLGRDLRLHRGLAPARPVPQGHQHHRQLHQHHGRSRLSRPDPPERAQADPHLPAGRRERQPRPSAGTASYDPTRDWHAQNIKMVEALTEKKYDVNYTWGIGTHSNKQGGAIMPEMLRWLWRDYPRPDDPKDPSNRTLLVPHDTAK